MLIVGALALAWADGVLGRRTIDEVSTRDAAVMGVGQALALQPGLSRSGVTMTLGRYMGLGRDAAVRFAFLMSLPHHRGRAGLQGRRRPRRGGVPPDLRAAFLWGIVASAVTGYIAVWGMLKLVANRSFAPFVLYRLVPGLVVWLSWPLPSGDRSPRPGATPFEHPGRPLPPEDDPTARIVDPVGAQPQILQRVQARPSSLGPRLGRLDAERLGLDLTLIDDESRVAPSDTWPPAARGPRTIHAPQLAVRDDEPGSPVTNQGRPGRRPAGSPLARAR